MDARKLKEKATEAFAKGKFSKAAEAYADYCAADPKDLQARLRMGDAWSKAGQKDKAIGAYQFAAEGFAKEGFLPRAIAASKLILELDPAHKGVQKMLAELYARKSGPTPARKPAPMQLGMAASNKHAPIELPKADDVPLEIEGGSSLHEKKGEQAAAAAPSNEIAIEVETSAGPKAPGPIAAEFELDVSVTGGGVAPLPPPPPPPSAPAAEKVEVASIEVEVEPAEPATPPTAPRDEPLATADPAVPPPPPPPSAPTAQPVYELELDDPPTAPPPLAPAPVPPEEPAGERSGRFARTTSGAYELKLDEPAPETLAEPPAPEEPIATVQGVLEKSQFQLAEESGRFKRTNSGAYELDLDDAPVDEQPIELTQPKPSVPTIDEAKLLAELDAAAEPPAPPTVAPVRATQAPAGPGEASAGPPGLRPKRVEADASAPSSMPASPKVDAPPASRLWFPNNVVAAPSSEQSAARRMPAPTKAAPRTDLERSLEAFSKFDDEVQIFDPGADGTPAAPPPPPEVPKGRAHTFTELELEGDSLLHAVETAANIGLEQRGQAAVATVVEEQMEAPEEPKLEPGALPKIPLFSDLPEDAFIALFERCPLRRFEPTDVVIQQGSLGDSFFVICAGSVKVFRVDGEVRRDIATLGEGAFFGEMALLSGAARTASVEAGSEDTQLLEISAPLLTELSHKFPPVATALKKFCRQRLLTNVMSSSALFAPFSRNERRQLVERFRARDVQKGDVLIKEGQRSDGMYIVLSGEIDVRLGQATVAALKEGDIFGEMSLLTKAPATASCAAARRTSLLRLPREDFDQLVLSHPQILVLVSELTDERKKQNATHASRAPSAGGEATPMV